jgi:hypothetical protein
MATSTAESVSNATSSSASPPPPPFKFSEDALFKFIEESQAASGKDGAPNFGSLLDSGTGLHSLKWLNSLEQQSALSSWVAVTADEGMRSSVDDERALLNMSKGEVVIGNWASVETKNTKSTIVKSDVPLLKDTDRFDTILADYLIGAIDGFSPFFQEKIFSKLVSHLSPGGKVYVVGLNPIPDSVEGGGDVFCRVTKARDACILLAGHRCYREYPVEWIEGQMKSNGLKVTASKRYPILYSHASIVRQIAVARTKLPLFKNDVMREGMRAHLKDLEEESLEVTKNGRIKLGFDYVVCAELASDSK